MLSAAGSGKDNHFMEDPRKIILSNLDIHSCRVEFTTAPIVLLCGGEVKEKERPDDPAPPISSFRDALTRDNHSSSFELFRPEEITNWQSDAIFKNLMEFEADLASICTLVVIILESPGSIAELGAFSQLPDLSKKIIVIKSNRFTDDNSFINLGILRYISKAHESSIKTYPWEIDEPRSITTEVIEDAIKDIQYELSILRKSEVFKLQNNSHVIVLICELVTLFVALKEKEILEYLTGIGVRITMPELRSKLFLLQRFNLIEKKEYSDSVFYLVGRDSFHKLRLVFKPEFKIDALRIPIECVAYYNDSDKERHRTRVIKKISSGSAK